MLTKPTSYDIKDLSNKFVWIEQEKKMKKLSLLIAICMLLTIGGVYATWIYSGNQIDAQTEPFVSKMGGLDHEGNSGSYSFIDNSLDFAVEPDTQDTKITTIAWGTGSIQLVFTPKGDINDAMLAKALNATLTVELASSSIGEYNSTAVYTIDPDFAVTLTKDNWTSHNDGEYYTYTITADTIKDAISIGNFHLPSEDDYVAFKAVIQDVKFRVKVTPAA